ncbi:rab3 GTPase-activating protein catalytic subunit [Nilaparvata lugens]|uniref:rab3 GTPase-activating protein catalytic subunit n=1 Tax=Nilaparvata lugens TaxID=108931 RepID=UPI00193D8A89|nr:rab3 GTPase-activating protein catalytic subunit [Nilaparvata lugens]XP_039279364.1 rab3 GTPase-activating protein catalytic subunit [Nilaparvata lugens]XP_039279365.1 rab3 GTPase-activating protein catalytic subunit [Nilaparvata lugens]XP_039279366.1 rab3 GTPase-activating protein catalytic subunit [Nilaparvata lugens]
MSSSTIHEDLDEDVYHCDFTTASEWEIFIARLEEIIHEWKLSSNSANLLKPLKSGQLSSKNWASKCENILFADFQFTITRYSVTDEDGGETLDSENLRDNDDENVKLQALEDMMHNDNDFIPVVCNDNNSHPHVLARLYSLREFIVINPASSAMAKYITEESKIKILLSSICIAINNCSCEVPVFIQALEPWRNFYLGLCEGRGIRAEFEMVHLKKIPQDCKHLTGLLNVFKSRLGLISGTEVEPVRVSAKFTYSLTDWTSYAWSQEPPNFELLQGEIGVEELGTLPFGASMEPVSELMLHAVWPDFLETALVDSQAYSDLEPLRATNWFVSARMVDEPACLLSEYMFEIIELCRSQHSMHEFLGDFMQHDSGPTLTAPLDVLTESKVPSIGKVIGQSFGQSKRDKSSRGPISNDMLMPILYFLFPDADNSQDSVRSPYPETIGNAVNREPNMAENVIGNGFKSAPIDGLVWRLAVVMAHTVHTLGGTKAAAHLWYEFCQELRFRWNNGIKIPGVAPGFPDLKMCLLNQKLQMLNCCIERRNAVTNAALASAKPSQNSDESEEEEEEEDDEFFDCAMSEEDVASHTAVERSKPRHSLWNRPVGRLCRHGNLKLLNSNEFLYIPITQEATPKTEDQIDEDAEVLVNLGSDVQGSELRTQLMSASLLSDIESFKAANPGAVLEDFIRWYSPRDWIEDKEPGEDGVVKGTLSSRMQIPGNPWLEIWSVAKPVPARRQNRLFDYTREAEKVLHRLDLSQPADAARMLLCPLMHASLLRLTQQALPIDMHRLIAAIKHISSKAETLFRVCEKDINRFAEICKEVAHAEAMIAQVASLEHKLCPGTGQTWLMKKFLSDLVVEPEVAVPGGPHSDIGKRIKSMFAEARRVVLMTNEADQDSSDSEKSKSKPSGLNAAIFPKPTEKEFILRVRAPCQNSFLVMPHRLTVRLSSNAISMAGCFSQDTTFQ